MKSDQELLEFAKKNGIKPEHIDAYVQGQGTQTQQPQQPQTIADLIGKFSPILKNTLVGGMEGMTNNASKTTPLDIAYKKAQIEALQNKNNNLIPIMDESGNVTGYQQAPQGNIKFPPVGFSPVYMDKAKAQTESARAGIPLKEAQTENAIQGGELVKKALGGEGGAPVGSTVTSGGVTIPLNPKLDESQTSAVAGAQALEPIVSKIEQQLQGGVLNSKLGKIGRTMRAGLADSKEYLLTSLDPKLQSFQSDLNALKKTLPFTEGGKQLTPFEAKQVFALLNITGKSNEQIVNDIGQALAIIREKERLALGGRNAALQGQQQPEQSQQVTDQTDFSTMSDEELKQIANSA